MCAQCLQVLHSLWSLLPPDTTPVGRAHELVSNSNQSSVTATEAVWNVTNGTELRHSRYKEVMQIRGLPGSETAWNFKKKTGKTNATCFQTHTDDLVRDTVLNWCKHNRKRCVTLNSVTFFVVPLSSHTRCFLSSCSRRKNFSSVNTMLRTSIPGRHFASTRAFPSFKRGRSCSQKALRFFWLISRKRNVRTFFTDFFLSFVRR